MPYETVCVSTEGWLGLIQLNRPEKLNALSRKVLQELVAALQGFERDEQVRCILLYENDKAFAAGSDVDEISSLTAIEMYQEARAVAWDAIRRTRKPLIAAVSGYAFGGGCELAMACDLVVASETARFGQPEINLGIMPGAGGTQRLPRAVGKALAMEMVLTGRPITAAQALAAGLINRVAPVEGYLAEAKQLADDVAAKAPIAARVAKQSVLQSFNTTLESGLEYERQSFNLLFSSEDRHEGMQALRETRKPQWKGR